MRPIYPLMLVGLVAAVAGCSPPATTPSSGTGTTAAPAGGSASAGSLKLGMMPKKKGIPYFNACQKGAEEAAAELKDVQLIYEGPADDKSELQSSMLDTWVTQKFNAIAIACNDPDQISASLARARDEGVTVVTFDADANAEKSKRQFFVNQVDSAEISIALVDEMAKQAGPDAQVAVVSSSSTAPNQSTWLKAMDVYRKQKYPKMEVVTTEYAEEDQIKSRGKAESILKAYPKVKGIWGMTSVALPGVAQAVNDAGKKGQIAVVGLGTPNVMKEWVDKGVVKSVVLWNPVDLGYLATYVTRAVAKGELKPGATSIKAGRMGEKKIQGDVVLLGKPMIFTKDNIAQFDF